MRVGCGRVLEDFVARQFDAHGYTIAPHTRAALFRWCLNAFGKPPLCGRLLICGGLLIRLPQPKPPVSQIPKPFKHPKKA
jgi:hypothetical protein